MKLINLTLSKAIACFCVSMALLLTSPFLSAQNEFTVTVSVTDSESDFTIPIGSGTFAYSVDWGDGSTDATIYTTDASYDYGTAGDYTIKISGTFPQIDFNSSSSDSVNDQKLTQIVSWGTIAWSSFYQSFYGCSNLTVANGAGAPDLTHVTSLYRTFEGCIALSDFPDIDLWDTSNVTDFRGTFYQCTNFNGDVSTWNVAGGTNMFGMFYQNEVFNRDISGWNTSSAEDMNTMFSGAKAFNQDISGWDMSKVKKMNNMFFETESFNQDLGDWDLSSLTTMENIFQQATGMSLTNFDLTLEGWATDDSGTAGDGDDDIPSDIDMGSIEPQYCNAEDAVNDLSLNYDWIINTTFTDACLKFTVDGITGLEFTRSSGDFTINITDDFTAFDMGISVTSVTMSYTAATDTHSVTGTVENQFDGNTIDSTINLTVVNEQFESLSFNISGDFDLEGLTFSPSGLTFQYDNSNAVYILFGSSTISFDGNNIDLGLGDATTPGILIGNGALNQVNASITTDFSINGLSFSPNGLSFQYDANNALYELFGDTSIEFDGNTIDMVLGDDSDPGIEIVNGSLQQLIASITADFTINDLGFSPDGLTFQYESGNSLYELYGNASIAFDGNTIDIVLGDDSDPGIEIVSGSLQQLMASITADFKINDLDFSPDGLTFQYESNDSLYELYGNVSIAFEGNTMDIVLGDDSDPGIEIVNGSLQQLIASVTADFTINDLNFSPDGLTFQYESSNSLYELFGGTSITFDGNTMNIVLGDDSDPGIEIASGSLQQLIASISADFTINDLDFSPDGLTFQYESSNSLYELFGAATISYDGNTMDLELGDDTDPGIEISNGNLQTLNASVTADFSVSGLDFSPSGLTFQYDASNTQYELFGSADLTFDGNTMTISLGDEDSPGFVIVSGSLQSLNMGITADFEVGDVTLSPDDMTFIYDESLQKYGMYGTATITLDGNDIEINLGDESDPGLEFLQGSVDKINASITADFNMKEITFKSNGMGFRYDAQSNGGLFAIYGETDVTFDNETVSIKLGDSTNAGFEYYSNAVQKISMEVTADFTMKGIEFNPQNFGFKYDKANDQYEMYGTITSKIEGNSIDLSLGDSDSPGLVISNGVVDAIEMSVTAEFSFKNMTFSPDDLTFVYNKTDDLYEMYGSLSAKFDGETLEATFGDASDPGFKYKSGVVESINIGVSADFKLNSLEIIPSDLTFIYNKSGEKFEMYGDITFKIGSDEIEADLGDASDPGMIFENNEIKHVNIGVSTTFKISGLKIIANDVGVDWNSGSDYHLYGDADLSIANDNIDTDFGTFNDPGVVIRNGSLHSLDVDINSDIKLGNLEVETKSLVVKYSNDKFEVTGEMEIKEVFSLSVILGSGSQAGLEIDVSGSEPKFKIEDLTIDIEHANLGAIDLKQFKLEFNSVGIVESDVKVVFPEGWEVDADLKFRDVNGKAEIDEIAIDYEANNLDDAIEIFEGVQLTYLGGKVTNLTRPSQLEVSAGIGTIYGGGFTLDNKSATFLAMTDDVTISSREFKIDGSVDVGAYRTGTNSWNSLLGEGSIDLTAYFHHYVKATVNAKYPGDPLIEANLTAYFDSSGHFDGLLDVEFIVPHWVPFIGGKHYGSVDGAVRYKKGDLNDSYGAAWVRIKTFWHTYHEGAKYTFGSRHISSIGSGSIGHIESEINHDEGNRSLTGVSKVFDFEVPQPAPDLMLIDIDWEQEVDSALVTVIGPEGTYELTKAVITSQNTIDETPTMTYEENVTTIARDTVTTFLFSTPSALNEEEVIQPKLTTGNYQLVISFPNSETTIDTLQIRPKWQIPESNMIVNQLTHNSFDLEIDYWSSIPDSTLVSFYVNTENSYENGRLINHVQATNFDDLGNGTETLSYTPTYFDDNVTELYFYAVIEDGVNPPFQSVISSAYTVEFDLIGTVTVDDPSGTVIAEGLRVFLDLDNDGSFDTDSTGDLEPFNLVNENGQFSFPDIDEGTYNLRVVLPSGYRIVGGTDNFSAQSITFDGTPQQLTLQIETY
jgi:hypothetical protein